MAVLYTAEAIATDGGRNGHVESTDGKLKFELATPGSNKAGTNPEQLFACGYSACFGGAVEYLAKQQKIDTGAIAVTASIGLNKDDSGFSLSAKLSVTLPNLDGAAATKLVEEAHQFCPYSKATRGNIPVELEVNGQAVTKKAA